MKKNIFAVIALAIVAAFTFAACNSIEPETNGISYENTEFVQALIIPKTQNIAVQENTVNLHAAVLVDDGTGVQRIHLGAGDANRHFKVRYFLKGNDGTETWLSPDENKIYPPVSGSVTYMAMAEITFNGVKTLKSDTIEFTLSATLR